jgi:hypothetical protein
MCFICYMYHIELEVHIYIYLSTVCVDVCLRMSSNLIRFDLKVDMKLQNVTERDLRWLIVFITGLGNNRGSKPVSGREKSV